MPATPKRRWLQFSLRSLLALTLLCAIGLTAWLRYIGPFRHERRVSALVAELRGTVHTEPAEVGWIGTFFEEGYFFHIRRIELTKTRVTDAELALLRDLPRLSGLHVSQTGIGDLGVSQLSGLHELTTLDLNTTRVTDAAIGSLSQFDGLRCLSLASTAITDDSLRTVGRLRHLDRLDLHGTRITDAGVAHLARLKSLEFLCLSGTDVTDAGLEKLAGLQSLNFLELADTGVTEASMPLLTRFPELVSLDVEGTRILPATFRWHFPDLANGAVYGNTSYFAMPGRPRPPAKLTLNDATYQDALAYLSEYYELTIVPSNHAAQLLAENDAHRLTASLEGSSYSDTLRRLFTPRGVRPIVHYGCVQLITIDDPVREQRRMVLKDAEAISQSLCRRLYGGCPPLDGLQRNALLAPVQGMSPQLVSSLPRGYHWRLEEFLAAMKDLGLKTELDAAAFAERPELLLRQNFVPAKWHTTLGDALECTFDLFDAHGAIEDDTFQIRPGAAPD